MGFIKLNKIISKKNLPVLAGMLLVFGLFGTVIVSQQQQEVRSRAAGTGGTGNCATLNTSTDELVADDCTIPGGLNYGIRGNRNTIQGGLGGWPANIFGDGNLIMGGMNGTINGNGNEICGGLNGGINGNNNIIHGGVGGPINGTGNQINVAGICGIIRQPTQAPTATPTNPPATCADGIDNNQNELIDAGDPVCHTDGNQNNPDTYDPSRNEGPITPTITIIPSPTVSPTTAITPSPTIQQPTATTAPGSTVIKLDLLLHGIGEGGDSANPNSGGNTNPNRPQRNVTVEIFNSQNVLILTKTGSVSFSQSAGNFTGQVNLGNNFATGSYIVKVKSNQFLRSIVPGIQNLNSGQDNQSPTTILINGDIKSDNVLNILDYNLLMGCYSDFLPAPSCTNENKILSDLDDDGATNQFDYNLFLRELTNRDGQ